LQASRKLLAAAAAIALAGLISAPAIARSGRQAVGGRLAARSLHRNLTDHSFAGWRFTTKADDTIAAKFRVPKLSCGRTTAGVSPGVLMATGAASHPYESGAFLEMECEAGQQVMQTYVVVNCISFCSTEKAGPAPHVGDTMEVGVTRSGGHVTQVAVGDLTPHHKFSLSDAANGAFGLLYTELIDDDLIDAGRELPVANFGTLSWSSGTITAGSTSTPIGSVPIGSTGREGYNMTSKTNVLQISTGAIGGTSKNAFTTTWKHA
jgi:hypothetical protein